jgi:hypothetical protein
VLGIFSALFNFVTNFPTYLLAGAITILNAILAGVGALVTGLFALLPTMPETTELGSPEWLRWLNWFLPVTAILGLMATTVLLYVSYLAVRWLLQLLRAG